MPIIITYSQYYQTNRQKLSTKKFYYRKNKSNSFYSFFQKKTVHLLFYSYICAIHYSLKQLKNEEI